MYYEIKYLRFPFKYVFYYVSIIFLPTGVNFNVNIYEF